MKIHITSRMHLSKQLISEHASLETWASTTQGINPPCPGLSRNEPLMILITAPPLVTRTGITKKIHRLQSFPHTWPRLKSKTCKVCWGFSVEPNSFSSQTRIANPKNLPTTSCRNNPMPICNIGSNQINNTTRSRQPPSRGPASKTIKAVTKGKSASKQSTPRPNRITKEKKKLILKRLRGAFTRPRSETRTTIFPTNMTKPALISTNKAGNKSRQSSRQQAKRPHESTSKTT